MSRADRPWLSVLLLEIRRIGGRKRELRIAADLAGVSMKTIRRHMVNDPSLAALIREADEAHRREKRLAERRRRMAAEQAREREVRVERARVAAAARWRR